MFDGDPVVKKLEAEIEWLTKLAKEQGQEIAITRERDERLEAEIEQLRAALDIARTGLLKIERQSEEARAMITRTHEQKAPSAK